MLRVETLSVRYGRQMLIEPVSFEVLSGQSLVIMGETGAGKSLIASAIMGTLPRSMICKGSVWLGDNQIDQLSLRDRKQLWGRKLSLLPQEPWRSLDPLMRSFAQVYETHRYVADETRQASTTKTEQQFTRFDLTDAKHKRPWELSGGMGQRVSFCASLAGGARILLADEPTKGLDSSRIDTVIEHLQRVPASGGVLILITHDVAIAKRFDAKMMVMRDGYVIENGNTDRILRLPLRAYTNELIEANPEKWQKPPSAVKQETMLILNKLVVGRQSQAIIAPLDLTVFKGSRIAITGPSGIGKSTLLDTLAGLIKPVSGRFEKVAKFNATDIQKIYQDPPAAFAPTVSLKQNLLDVAKRHGVAWQIITDLLRRLNVGETLLDRRPDEVSGGELQRIAIARALAVKPKILLADEPTSRLDPLTQKHTMQLLAEVAADHDTAVLLVTHDRAIANQWAESTIALKTAPANSS